MKVVLLAGGLGTRIAADSHLKPKPMIEIGGRPILWHIMKNYAAQGFNEFIICCGYRSEVIKRYFADYFLYHSDMTFDYRNGNTIEIHHNAAEPWQVTVVDTGLNTMTGGRIKRIQPYIGNNPFMLTYGDGVSNVDLNKLLQFHQTCGTAATITVVQPEGRFGVADIEDNHITSFREKSGLDVGWINGGFMVLEPEVFDYIEGDNTVFEQSPLEKLAQNHKLSAFRHIDYWQCMDTQRDRMLLEKLWEKGDAPWKIWNK
ncbi:glucose-1-phosphate cytidylyltransferase [Scatolibacter rhodanostii]|uniref:glucose-1-phosphate cytidylyltransferase n=1 Tax=Scatolibacter rhodanostii TaxID=2014781 RepID=UPI000C08937E|nr:glucose-1-phosphate cytidylyltransferase [Scatolibacter rhodanostii]